MIDFELNNSEKKVLQTLLNSSEPMTATEILTKMNTNDVDCSRLIDEGIVGHTLGKYADVIYFIYDNYSEELRLLLV